MLFIKKSEINDNKIINNSKLVKKKKNSKR